MVAGLRVPSKSSGPTAPRAHPMAPEDPNMNPSSTGRPSAGLMVRSVLPMCRLKDVNGHMSEKNTATNTITTIFFLKLSVKFIISNPPAARPSGAA